MPSAKVKPEKVDAETPADDGMVGASKVVGKKKPPKKAAADGAAAEKSEASKKKKFTRKGDEDPFGDPNDYPTNLPLGARHIVEFHERTDPSLKLEHFADTFHALLPREQTQVFQKLMLFDQMIGRMINTGARFAYETDYDDLCLRLRDGVKEVLNVEKVRLFGVDYNSLGWARSVSTVWFSTM